MPFDAFEILQMVLISWPKLGVDKLSNFVLYCLCLSISFVSVFRIMSVSTFFLVVLFWTFVVLVLLLTLGVLSLIIIYWKKIPCIHTALHKHLIYINYFSIFWLLTNFYLNFSSHCLLIIFFSLIDFYHFLPMYFDNTFYFISPHWKFISHM